MQDLNIFIASSEELASERKDFTFMQNFLNQALREHGIRIIFQKWEHFDASMSKEHMQEEYNKILSTCDMCIALFWTRFGEYTQSEVNTASAELLLTNNIKKLLVYAKKTEQQSAELATFKEEYKQQGNTIYEFTNSDELRLTLLLHLNAYYENKYKEILFKMDGDSLCIANYPLINLNNISFAWEV